MSMNEKFNNENDIKKEADELIKNFSKYHKSEFTIYEELKKKGLTDKQIENVTKTYKDNLDYVKRLATKIKNRFLERYSNLTKHESLIKIDHYQDKYKFSNAVKDAVIYLIFTSDKLKDYEEPYTNMSKALGYIPKSQYYAGKINIAGDEEAVNKIMELHAKTSQLHKDVQLQSLTYDSCSSSALMNGFEREKYDMHNSVHPVLFALFFPKFDILERQMIFASITNIVTRKKNGEELNTSSDAQLYNDICIDPVETTCTQESNKPFTDLLARANVQTQLWTNIKALRSGSYYSVNKSSFMTVLDMCKNNIYDMADYAYVSDDATILRKLFSAFSFRPTFISTAKLPSNFLNMSSNSSNLPQVFAPHVETIIMLPLRLTNEEDETKTLNLKNALMDKQVMNQHGQLIVKDQQVISSRDLLVFYVNRRFHKNNITRVMMPYQMPTLPLTVSTYESLNDIEVAFSLSIPVGSQIFNLRSAVAVETVTLKEEGIADKNQIITDSSALVFSDIPDMVYQYKPIDRYSGSNKFVDDKIHADSNKLYPISLVGGLTSSVPNSDNAYSILSRRGTLFIYECPSKGSTNEQNVFGL